MNKERGYNFEHIVKLMYKSGYTINEIAKSKNVQPDVISKILIDYRLIIRIIPKSSEILGSKQEPYYKKEKDQMYLPVYNVKDLKKAEKKIYESRKDK